MSTLLSKKYNVVETNRTKHKQRIKYSKKPVDNLKNEVENKLNGIIHSNWYRKKKLTYEKVKRNVLIIIKDEMEELTYIQNHFRTSKSLQRYTGKIIAELSENIERIIKLGYK